MIRPQFVNPYRRAIRVLIATLVAYGVLVGANEGEFWPFSIYPMFSQGGNPWSRAIVRDVATDDSARWSPVTSADLPGEPYPLFVHGVDPIDLSNFVSKTERWDDARIAGLRKMFGEQELRDRALLVMRVNGRINQEDSVIVEFVPYVRLSAEESRLNETLSR